MTIMSMTRMSLTLAFFLNSALEHFGSNVELIVLCKDRALPQYISALVNISGEVEVLDHEGNVAIPGLVETQDPDPGVHLVHGEQGPDCPGHGGGFGAHLDTVRVSEMNENDAQIGI